MTVKVKLREKPISGNRQSLYLDFYPAIIHPKTGELTRREFLGLYVFDKPKSVLDKQHNIQTKDIANQIRVKKENELNKPEVYAEFEKDQLKKKQKGEKDFVAYFKSLVNKRKSSNYDNWNSAYNYLHDFTNGSLRFSEITVPFCNDFREYLLTTKSKKSETMILSQNSALSYFNKFKAALKQAFKEEHLNVDISSRVEGIKEADTKREYLNIEELNALVKISCKKPTLKSAALFSAVTGLRFSDIEKLVWGEIEFSKSVGYSIRFQQKKTKGFETLPISKQAFELLGKRKLPGDRVFPDLIYSAYLNRQLNDWIKEAGITKKITFHCFRHTYATLQLGAGTDIFTISKLLGHRHLKTTQIYAKVMDENKRKAADKIVLDI